MRHPTSVLALTVLTALVVAGCAGTTPGTAIGRTAQTTATTPGTTTAADPLAGVDPCSLLDPAVMSQNHLHPDTSGTELGVRYCRWDTGATTNGIEYTIAININDDAGLNQLNRPGFAVTNYPVGSHQGRMSKRVGGSTCAVSIGVTGTSRIDIVGSDRSGQQDRSCVEATTVAPSIEQRLPSATG
ncbi:MAG TPA: DUF3558 family protein [Pseudonocardiaceae bacterium]|nr:DUF3558 family protein [Pseudonocardiaceae bacterium]